MSLRRRPVFAPAIVTLLLLLFAVAPAALATGRAVFGELFSVDG